jgi:predicted transcriptional regulator
MSKKDQVLNCCRDQARTAKEIASLLQMDKTIVKITLLYCFKKGLVTREKKDRPAMVRGPKQEFYYLCQQS